MLNDRLRPNDLVYDLNQFGTGKSKGKFLHAIDIITDEIAFEKGKGFKDRQVQQNRKLLGKLHHIFHIADYKKPDFREELLKHADPSQLKSFLKQLGIIPENIDESTFNSKIFSYCKEASKRPWGNNDDTINFVNTFGYESSLIPTTKESHDAMEEISTSEIDPDTGNRVLQVYSNYPYRPLYSYQSQLFFEADVMVETKYNRFMIMMPTGAGKTRLAMEIISHFLTRGVRNNKDRQVVWLADSEELLEQAIETFKNVFPHLAEKNTKLYRLWGKYKSQTYEKNSIIIASYQTLVGFLERNPDSLNPDLIVCDEAHNVIAESYKPTIEKLARNGSPVIGLTATPIRTLKGKGNNDLKEFFYWDPNSPQSSFIDIKFDEDRHDNTIDYLQKNGYLSHAHKYDIDTENLESLISIEILRGVSKSRDLSPKFLEILAQDNERNRKIATKLLEIGKQKKRTLYFGTTRYQAQLICAIMILDGINAVYLDGNTPQSYRNDCIKKFKNGEIDIICNCDLFTTGFDDPEIEVIMIGRPTKSLVLHQQMIGRGMRGPKMGGTKEFDLYRIHDELPSIELADDAMSDFWSK
jgi:DNA repair protein RadD